VSGSVAGFIDKVKGAQVVTAGFIQINMDIKMTHGINDGLYAAAGYNLIPAATNPGDDNTIWLRTDGTLMRGSRPAIGLQVPVTVAGAGGSPDALADGDTAVYLLDGTANTCTLDLDAAPVNGQTYTIKSIDSTNTVTIGRNGNNIDGAGADLILSVGQSYKLVYDTTYGWATV